VPHLPFLNQVLHRSRHVFDRHRGVNPVLIVQVNRLDPEPFERTLGALLDVLGPAIHKLLPAGIDLDPELGGDHHLPADGSQGFADEGLVAEGAVHFSRIKERHAAVDG